MTSTVKSYLFYSFSITVFVIALGIGVSLYRSMNSTLETVRQSNTSLNRNIHSTLKELDGPLLTGQEVALTVTQIPDTQVDVLVNGQLFSHSLQFEDIDISGINTQKNYTINLERDASGLMIRVIYTAQ